jgi:hypothetical protein
MGFDNPAFPERRVASDLNFTCEQKMRVKLIYRLIPLLPVGYTEKKDSPPSRTILTKITKNIKQEEYQGKT